MRQDLCRADLTESELRLAFWLIGQTYDLGDFSGPTDFHGWAADLGYSDAKSLRPKDCMAVFEQLERLGILDWNRAQGTFELRPYRRDWFSINARAASFCKKANQEQLNLRAERPLSEARNELSRECALSSGPNPAQPPLQGRSPGWADSLKQLKEVLDGPQADLQRFLEQPHHGNPELSASGTEPGKFPGDREKIPVSLEPGKNPGGDRENSPATQRAKIEPVKVPPIETPGKFPGGSIVSLAPVQKAKLALRTGPEEAEAALRYLQSVDRAETLRGKFAREYEALCEHWPRYVLDRLKPAFEEHERYYSIKTPGYKLRNPVGWMGGKAAREGKMRWHGRR